MTQNCWGTSEQRRRISPKSWSVLLKIRGSIFLPSSHNCFRLWEFFSPTRSNSRVFSVGYPEFINSGLFILSFQYHSLNLTGVSFKWSLIGSCSLRLMYLNTLKYLHSFCNSSRWFVHLLRSISILTVVRSRVLFLCYHINSFVVSILLVFRWRPYQVIDISLNPSLRE